MGLDQHRAQVTADLELLADKTVQEPTDALAVRRRHPGAADGLGQVHVRADRLQFLHHEPPAGRRLQRDFTGVGVQPAASSRSTVDYRHATRA
jgi:hypothetical protein